MRRNNQPKLGALAVTSSTLADIMESGCLELDHNRSRTTLWKAAQHGDRLLLVDASGNGTLVAGVIVSKSIKVASRADRPDPFPWQIQIDVQRWGSHIDPRDRHDLTHRRYPFRENQHLPGNLFDRAWHQCNQPLPGAPPEPTPPRYRGRRGRYAISVAITAEERDFVNEIGELHPSGRSRRDQKFAFVARKDDVLCGAIQVGLPRPNAPRHHLAMRRFGDDFDQLRSASISIVRLLTPDHGVSKFAVHRALLQELCAVAPNMVATPLTYIDGASYQYHPLAVEFGFRVELPSRPGGSFYFWKPYNLPRRYQHGEDPTLTRQRVKRHLTADEETNVRVWIAKANNDRLLSIALEKQTWALRDSQLNKTRWSKIGRDDILLLVNKDRITHATRVRGTTKQVIQGYEDFPLQIRFTVVEEFDRPLYLEDHLGAAALQQLRTSRGGLVEAAGVDPQTFSGTDETPAEPSRVQRERPANRQARQKKQRPAPPARSRESGERTQYAKILSRPPQVTKPAPTEALPSAPAPTASDQEPETPTHPTSASDPASTSAHPPIPAPANLPLPHTARPPTTHPAPQPATRTSRRTTRRARRPRGRLAVDAQIDGYTLVARLGRGHSAEVWHAEVQNPPFGTDLEEGQDVAIKFYSNTILARPHQSLRIQREFLVASQIDHPHIVPVHDLVISPNRPNHSFLVMDFVEGRTLKDLIRSTSQQAPGRIAQIGVQLFDALDELHSQDALHRDIKAANIIDRSGASDAQSNEPNVVLLDLGIVAVETENRVTTSSTFLGSKHYASLEQLSGERLTAQSDIYGVGATLFHLYDGREMYNNAGPAGGIVRQMIEEPEKLTPRSGASPPEHALVKFINRCIAREQADRPVDANAAFEELERITSELNGLDG